MPFRFLDERLGEVASSQVRFAQGSRIPSSGDCGTVADGRICNLSGKPTEYSFTRSGELRDHDGADAANGSIVSWR